MGIAKRRGLDTMTPEEYRRYLCLRRPKEPTMIKTYNMDDVGTRIEHMSDLQDIWSGGLAMLLSGKIGRAHV